MMLLDNLSPPCLSASVVDPFWAAYVGCGLLCVLLAYLGGRRRRLRSVDAA